MTRKHIVFCGYNRCNLPLDLVVLSQKINSVGQNNTQEVIKNGKFIIKEHL